MRGRFSLQLDLKTTGWGPASQPTVRRLELFADWIEAQSFLQGSYLSQPDLVDRLENTALVKDSDDAWLLVGDAFATCRTRRKQMGVSYPFNVAGDHIEWIDESKTAYIFCLFASLPEQLKGLRQTYPTNFRDIFEEIVAESLRQSMPYWSVYATGWSATAAGGKNAIVQSVAGWIRAKHYDLTVFPNANDAQVDIAIVRSFADERSAFPVFLGQCATGVTDWKQKASRPNLDRWTTAVQFSSNPLKMFAVPFALDDVNFWKATVECKGLVLDRSRICTPLNELPAALDAKIATWLDAIKPILPLAA